MRKNGRVLMRKKIRQRLNELNNGGPSLGKKKQFLPALSIAELDDIIWKATVELQDSKNMEKAFHLRGINNDGCYEHNMKNYCLLYLEKYDKDSTSSNPLYFDNKNYQNNKNKNSIYDERLWIFKRPQNGFICQCGWLYCNKYNKDRISKHYKICPINSLYGIVPFISKYNNDYDQLSNENVIDELCYEYNGYKRRIDNNKCLFKLKGRVIRITTRTGNKKCIIMKDCGNGYIDLRYINEFRGRKHVLLKELRFNGTKKIWLKRNYRDML